MRLFHGTDLESAAALAAGEKLDAQKATDLHVDGEPGFYLASDVGDAEFFAVRLGPGRVLSYEVSAYAVEDLLTAGATYQRVPMSAASPYFRGSELFIPVPLFPRFNGLMEEGEIIVDG